MIKTRVKNSKKHFSKNNQNNDARCLSEFFSMYCSCVARNLTAKLQSKLKSALIIVSSILISN